MIRFPLSNLIGEQVSGKYTALRSSAMDVA